MQEKTNTYFVIIAIIITFERQKSEFISGVFVDPGFSMYFGDLKNRLIHRKI